MESVQQAEDKCVEQEDDGYDGGDLGETLIPCGGLVLVTDEGVGGTGDGAETLALTALEDDGAYEDDGENDLEDSKNKNNGIHIGLILSIE